MMWLRSALAVLLLSVLAAACSEEPGGDALLRKPPFAALTDSIDGQPEAAGLYYRRGVLLYQNSQPRLAEADLRRAWELAPTEEHALSLTRVLRERDPAAAAAFLKAAGTQLPESIALQVGLARGYQQLEQHDEALALTDSLIAAHPNQLDALLLRAELLEGTDRPAEALKALEQAYSYAPFDAELAHQLAFAYAETKNPKAVALSDSLIRADSLQRHAEPYYFKGVYFANLGMKEKALAFFNEAVRHDYYFLDAYMDKGRLQYNQRQYPDALRTFQLAATVSPTFADAYLWQGRVQQAMGDKAEARLNYQRAYGLDKTLEEAREAERQLR